MMMMMMMVRVDGPTLHGLNLVTAIKPSHASVSLHN